MTTNIDENVRQAIREEIAASQQRAMFDPQIVRQAALVLGQVNVVDTIDTLTNQVSHLATRNGIYLGSMATPGLGDWMALFAKDNQVWRRRVSLGGAIEWQSAKVTTGLYIDNTGYPHHKDGLAVRLTFRNKGSSYDSSEKVFFGIEPKESPEKTAWTDWMSGTDKIEWELKQEEARRMEAEAEGADDEAG
jgi:hypothetical protein